MIRKRYGGLKIKRESCPGRQNVLQFINNKNIEASHFRPVSTQLYLVQRGTSLPPNKKIANRGKKKKETLGRRSPYIPVKTRTESCFGFVSPGGAAIARISDGGCHVFRITAVYVKMPSTRSVMATSLASELARFRRGGKQLRRTLKETKHVHESIKRKGCYGKDEIRGGGAKAIARHIAKLPSRCFTCELNPLDLAIFFFMDNFITVDSSLLRI
ncbi:hypothetical protein CEXT_804611 [Caerostris extrusa]|uniref:Uncharacterized protein n=1 Tax=Caerostris extrusa TaxID=172846 RepID=A0AAV4UC34_CAEEX|nr:hypothetical protein CEXT_804611 [Caerostris extrusa]